MKRIRAGFVGASVALQSDGKIVIGGYALEQASASSVQRIFVIVRLLQDGTPDASFGTGGVLKSVLDINQSTTLTSLTLQADGKIVVTGYTAIAPGAGPQALILARYGANGTLDDTFDGDGRIFITVNPSGNRGNSVKIQPDGKIVVGGSLRETTGTITDFLVVRRNADGRPARLRPTGRPLGAVRVGAAVDERHRAGVGARRALRRHRQRHRPHS